MIVAEQSSGKNFTLWNGDCVEVARAIPTNSIGYSIHSPPFISLYTFSDDPRDMSNCRDDQTFWDHYKFLADEMFRATKNGRLASVHVMNLPTSITRDGFIGVRDFRGDVIRLFQKAGFYFHSEVMIRKDPVVAATRSKSIGLLHKQLLKDSTLSRMALADYVVTFRKSGVNDEPVAGPFDTYYGDGAGEGGSLRTHSAWYGTKDNYPGSDWYSVAVWQRYAESVWTDITQGDVLSHKVAREEHDERHISPLQLTVIRRCLDLWSNPGDVVFSPFAGIGSELYVALEMGRKAIGSELKKSYYDQAVKNCLSVDEYKGDIDLFSASAVAAE